jgi:hypothetical protein
MSDLDTDIDLGNVYEDTISGYTGVVTAIADHLTGCTRVELSQVESSTASSEWFYADQLRSVDAVEAPDYDHDVVTSCDFTLAEFVRDTVTDFKGYVVTITYELFNCPRILVEAKDDEKDVEGFDAPRIVKAGDGMVDEFETDEKTVGETGAACDDVVRSPDRV